MFTGIVESMGTVVRVLRRGGGARLEVRAPDVVSEVKIGDSVAVNGACVTVTAHVDDTFACDLVPETLARTNLGTLQPGEEVNLELPMRAGGRLDGHIVQGHVDVVGTIRSRRRVGAQEMLEVTVPFELTRYLAPKGSVSVEGVSLTIMDVNKDRFRVALIPHTVETTTLGKKIQGAAVNVEVDVISKYVERHLSARAPVREPSLAELVGPPPPRPEPLAAQALRIPVPPAPRSTPAPAPKPASKSAPAPKTKGKTLPRPVLKRPAAKAAKRSTPKRSTRRR
ncbi:MAG: riboflavin synthase [Actinomycetota bacterium]